MATPAIPQENPTTPAPTPLEVMTTEETYILTAIKEIEDRATEFASLAREVNKVSSGATKNRSGLDQAMNRLLGAFPGVVLLLLVEKTNPLEKDAKLLTDPALIKTAIQRWSQQYDKTRPSSCFAASTMAFSNSRGCSAKLSDLCKAYGSDGKGQLSIITIGDDLGINNHEVRSPDDLNQYVSATSSDGSATEETFGPAKELLQAWVDGGFQFCAAVSSSGHSWDVKETYGAIPTPPAAQWIGAPSTLGELTSECLDSNGEAALVNLYALRVRFPEYAMVTSWKSALEHRSRVCREAIVQWCSNTYEIEGELIASYVTKQCEIREVTAEDVDNDIRNFAQVGMTKASRLLHGQLKEEILACSKARAKGYEWTYARPSPEGCHPSDK
jgi:hypothetical protein